MAYDAESHNTNHISQQRLVEQFFVRGNKDTIQNSEIRDFKIGSNIRITIDNLFSHLKFAVWPTPNRMLQWEQCPKSDDLALCCNNAE